MLKKPTKRNQEYWDKILSVHGLGMDRGLGGKTKYGEQWLNYSGDSKDLDNAQSQVIAKKTGRKKPKGKGPE